MKTEICVIFIASSDNTKDVFKTIAPSYFKYFTNVEFKKHIGLNTYDKELYDLGFTPILSPKTNWREEIKDQISQLNTEYVILLLDDFLLLSPANQKKINQLVNIAKSRNLDYLRLIPLSGSWLFRIYNRLKVFFCEEKIITIPDKMPYFSSLQAAIWRKSHLLDMLKTYTNDKIWMFEHHYITSRKHHAIAHTPPINYTHLVEKGKWLWNSKKILSTHGFKEYDKSKRETLKMPYLPKIIASKFIFNCIGYSYMKTSKKFKTTFKEK